MAASEIKIPKAFLVKIGKDKTLQKIKSGYTIGHPYGIFLQGYNADNPPPVVPERVRVYIIREDDPNFIISGDIITEDPKDPRKSAKLIMYGMVRQTFDKKTYDGQVFPYRVKFEFSNPQDVVKTENNDYFMQVLWGENKWEQHGITFRLSTKNVQRKPKTQKAVPIFRPLPQPFIPSPSPIHVVSNKERLDYIERYLTSQDSFFRPPSSISDSERLDFIEKYLNSRDRYFIPPR